jgi:polyketide cyclase/dehydrase/lipid transport protein
MQVIVRKPPAIPMRAEARRRAVALTAIKTVHTLAWFSIESCMVYLLYLGFRRKSDRRAAIAGAVVAGESLIFAGNGFHCPLTKVANDLGAERGGVTDIFLPRWFAHYLPVIHAPLLVLAAWLHGRNIRNRETQAVIENAIDIKRSQEDVFDYCSDHRHELEWNPKMRFVNKLSDGPNGVGTRYEMGFIPGRPLIAECVSFERPALWKVEGKALGMNVTLGGRVTPADGAAHLVLQTAFEAKGFRALALPLIRRRMWSEFERDVHTIKAILEAPTGSPAKATEAMRERQPASAGQLG